MKKRKKTIRGKKHSNGKPRKKKKPLKKIPQVIPARTLIEVPEREPLPPIPDLGRPCFLVQIVTENPDVYKSMIALVRNGVTGHVAAERLGINENTFYAWCKKGGQELAENPYTDTFYTRFYKDIRWAVATKRSELEIEIANKNPNKWLSHGPGRIFGDDWSEIPGRGTVVPDSPLSLPSPSPDQISSQEEIEDADFKVIDENTSLDALKELQDQGIIEVSRSYKSQVNKQEGES